MVLNDGILSVVVIVDVLPLVSCMVIGGDTLSVVVMVVSVSWLVTGLFAVVELSLVYILHVTVISY